MIGLDEDRAIADLRKLAQIGKFETGVHRPALSDADFEARRWLCDEMREAGLDGGDRRRRHGSRPRAGASAALLLGSHSDSVPYGGWLDGAMGCIFALAVARARQTTHPDAAVGVDVVSFTDEEGTFMACGGSRVFCWRDQARGHQTSAQRRRRAFSPTGCDALGPRGPPAGEA